MKDDALNDLAKKGFNVAQFASFSPYGSPRYARIRTGAQPTTNREAAIALLEAANSHSVNVRSFRPEQPLGCPFVYGLTTIDAIVEAAERLQDDGYHIILNETIDVKDGGVSGVILGDWVEFSPDDTPRCVEKPGSAGMARQLAEEILHDVYGVDLPRDAGNWRTEFSIHLEPRGVLNKRVIIWDRELLTCGNADRLPVGPWPNNFSRMIGDKTYGLLVAASMGLPVPKTIALNRRVGAFVFTSITAPRPPTVTRTAPAEPTPGRFATVLGPCDPFVVMANDDPNGKLIPTLLIQERIAAEWSGAAAVQSDGTILVEGVPANGADFMVGKEAPATLPAKVEVAVRQMVEEISDMFKSPVRIEWVADFEAVVIVQFHLGALPGAGQTIVPGEPAEFERFDVGRGLEELRVVAEAAKAFERGIILVGKVGIASHFGDVLRKAGVPSRLVAA